MSLADGQDLYPVSSLGCIGLATILLHCFDNHACAFVFSSAPQTRSNWTGRFFPLASFPTTYWRQAASHASPVSCNLTKQESGVLASAHFEHRSLFSALQSFVTKTTCVVEEGNIVLPLASKSFITSSGLSRGAFAARAFPHTLFILSGRGWSDRLWNFVPAWGKGSVLFFPRLIFVSFKHYLTF